MDELTAVGEIGPVMAESVYNFFRNHENLKIIKKDDDYEVDIVFDV